MLPGSWVAALLLVALIPGYAYLRLSEDARRPRDSSSLEELLEVLSVGLATTGVAVALFVLLWPGRVLDTLARATRHSPGDLRAVILLVSCIASLALGIACLASWTVRSLSRNKNSFAPNVWDVTLGLRREQHLPYAVLDLKDSKRRIEGVLHSYTVLEGDHPRDIALSSPKINEGGKTWPAGADYVVISAEEVSKIWFRLAPDPGQPAKPRAR